MQIEYRIFALIHGKMMFSLFARIFFLSLGKMKIAIKGKEKNMSPKELSYIEDTLSHLEEVNALCQSIESEVDSAEFKNLACVVADGQKQIYQRMMGLISV
jgi:hypothetical protein